MLVVSLAASYARRGQEFLSNGSSLGWIHFATLENTRLRDA